MIDGKHKWRLHLCLPILVYVTYDLSFFAADDAGIAVAAYRMQRDWPMPDTDHVFKHAFGTIDVEATAVALVVMH